MQSLETMISEDRLSGFIQNDDERFKILIFSIVDAVKSPNMQLLNPNPQHFFPDIIENEIENFADFLISDTQCVNRIIRFFKEERKTDRQYYESLESGKNFMTLLYFFIFHCKTSITKICNDEKITYWKVETENEIQNNDDMILMHGTRSNCIYSILRNSLRSMSGTNFMLHGSAYGNGVYLTDSMSYALGYASSTTFSPIGYIILCRVKNPKMKNKNIYVQNEDEISMVGFLTYRSNEFFSMARINEDLKINSKIERYFRVKRMNENEESSLKVMNSRRLKIEMKELTEGNIQEIRRIMIQNNRILIEINPTEGSKLERDCIEVGIPGVILSMHFPKKENQDDEYPITPPIIRVLRPIFVRGTGRVSEGGSICIDSVFLDGWSPNLTIRTMIVSIVDVISNQNQETNHSLEQGGRINMNRLGEDYSYEEFLRSYINTGIIHKWKNST